MGRAAAPRLLCSARYGVAAALALSVVAPAFASSWVEIRSHGVPARLEAAARRTVRLELVNRGAVSWVPAAGDAVSYHWLDPSGAVVIWDGARTELPGPVAPGDRIELDAVVEVPHREGTLRLEWDVVREGEYWLTELAGQPPPSIEVDVRAGYAFSVVEGTVPLWMTVARDDRRRIVVRNDGLRSWPAKGGIALSYHWLDRDGHATVWDGLRTVLPEAVEPGAALEVDALLRAPARAGRFRLQWDMVDEGVVWFSQRDPSPEPARPVIVVAPPWSSPAAWAVLSLAGAVAAAGISRRSRLDGWLTCLAAADVLWCVGAVVVKQQAVLAQSGQPGSLRTVVITVGGLALLLLPALLLKRRIRAWGSFALATLATAVLFSDLIYLRFFGDLLSAAVVGTAPQLGDVRASVASLIAARDLWFWLDLPAGAVIAAAVAKIRPPAGRRATGMVAVLLAAALAVGGATAAAAVRSGAVNPGQVFRRLTLAREIGILNAHVLDLASEAVTRLGRSTLDVAELDRLTTWFEQRASLRAGSGPWFGVAEGANLLMVQAESLQEFVLGLEVSGEQVTPFLNRWAEASLLFRNTTDQTGLGRSSDAELLTQVSLLPPAAGAAAFRFPDNHFTGLASALAERGYRTVSAVAYDGSFWNRRMTHAAFGFTESLFAESFEHGEHLGWGLNDRDFFRQMIRRLSRGRQPFCALLLTLSLHHPFAGFPDHLKELELGELEGSPLGDYLHTMRFFDRAFEELWIELESSGLADRTVVVLWGDHDAGLEWTARLAAMARRRHDDAGWYLSQRVPLVVRAPGSAGLRGEMAVPAGHQDVAPTALALLGVDPAPWPFIGRNLLGSPGSGPVVGEYRCWHDDKHLFLQGDGRLEGGRCLRLPELTPADPGACTDGFRQALEQVEASRRVLEHDLQQDIRDRLRDRLGVSR